MKQVLVIGAGYAGVAAANRIARRAGTAVTVVNPHDGFVERIRLHQLAAGSGTATVPLSDVLDARVRVRIGSVTAIGDGEVVLDDGGAMRFDRLVYAVGSGAAAAPATGHRVDTLEQARQLHDAVATLPAGGAVAVVGGGLTGLETVTELASARPDLTSRLITATEVLEGFPAPGRDRVRGRLRDLGVELREHTRVADPDALGADLVVWTTTPRVPALAADSGLPVDEAGRLLVDATLTSVGDRRIVGAGDAIAAPAEVGFVRASCQAATPLGVAAARTVLAGLDDRTAPAASVRYQARCVALGPDAALLQFVDRHDAPRRLALGGRTAALVKDQILRYTLRAVRGRAELGRAVARERAGVA